MHYFIGLMIISVCGECFNIDVRIYGTLLILFFLCVCCCLFCHFDIDVCIYTACTFVVVVGCQANFDVDNVQRCKLVNVYGV